MRFYKAHINFNEDADFNLEGDFSQYDDVSIGEMLEMYNDDINLFTSKHYIGVSLLTEVETYGNKPRFFITSETTIGNEYFFDEDNTYFGIYELRSIIESEYYPVDSDTIN
jgi:hypothetical protein